MSYAVEYEVPGNEEIYSKIKAEIGEDQPDGLVVQAVSKTARGLRHFAIWDSKDRWESFRDGRVKPAVERVLKGLGFDELPPPPVETQLEIVDIVTGRS